MSVIINDFEVVVEPPETPQEATPEAAEPPAPAPGLSPVDLEDALERQAQRQERLRAH